MFIRYVEHRRAQGWCTRVPPMNVVEKFTLISDHYQIISNCVQNDPGKIIRVNTFSKKIMHHLYNKFTQIYDQWTQ